MGWAFIFSKKKEGNNMAMNQPPTGRRQRAQQPRAQQQPGAQQQQIQGQQDPRVQELRQMDHEQLVMLAMQLIDRLEQAEQQLQQVARAQQGQAEQRRAEPEAQSRPQGGATPQR